MNKIKFRLILSMLLCVVIINTSILIPISVAGGPLDLSSLRESDLFEIDVNRENDCAFIDSALSISDRAFNHKYENDSLYSSTEFDILVLDYFEDSYPVFRLWIQYTADEFQYITSATFVIDGTDYTFNNISRTEQLYDLENGKLESLVIKFGIDNVDFLIALSELASIYEQNNLEGMDEVAIPMILHGKEDIEVTLGDGFLFDYMIVSAGFNSINGISYLSKTASTPMYINGSRTNTIDHSKTYTIISDEVYIAGEKLNGPSIYSSDVQYTKLTLSDPSLTDGTEVDFYYFNTHYYGTMRNGFVSWKKEPVILADCTNVYFEIYEYGSGMKLVCHAKGKYDLWAESHMVFK